MTWEESMQKPFCVPQNLITCTEQVWRQVFIAVVTFVAAIQESQLRNPKCYSTFSCLLTEPTLGITSQPQRSEQFPYMHPLSHPAILFSLWCRRNLLCLPFQQRTSPASLFTSSDCISHLPYTHCGIMIVLVVSLRWLNILNQTVKRT